MEHTPQLIFVCISQGVCTEAGMYALRERRVHVTQEDFEMAVAKVCGTIYLCFMALESQQYLNVAHEDFTSSCSV